MRRAQLIGLLSALLIFGLSLVFLWYADAAFPFEWMTVIEAVVWLVAAIIASWITQKWAASICLVLGGVLSIWGEHWLSSLPFKSDGASFPSFLLILAVSGASIILSGLAFILIVWSLFKRLSRK